MVLQYFGFDVKNNFFGHVFTKVTHSFDFAHSTHYIQHLLSLIWNAFDEFNGDCIR